MGNNRAMLTAQPSLRMLHLAGAEKWHWGTNLHRDGNPAVICTDGTAAWYKHGKLHREDGPAVEYNDGGKEWYVNGLYHRIDGPAIDYPTGPQYWFVNGWYKTTFEAFQRASQCTDEQVLLLKIKYGTML